MSMIDDIKRDREAGTPGPWRIHVLTSVDPNGDEWETDVEVETSSGKYIHGHDLGYGCGVDNEVRTNARRIARLPDLEAKYIALKEAADGLAEAVKAATDYASDASNGHLWFVTKKDGRDALVRLSVEEGQQDLNTFRSALARYREASQ
jgi:hypothetical protein